MNLYGYNIFIAAMVVCVNWFLTKRVRCIIIIVFYSAPDLD